MHVPLARYDTKSEGTPVERCLLERESEVSRNVQSTEDKLLHSGTRLFDQKIYFDGNQPRSIQFFHIFFVYYSSEWFESTKEQDIFNFARCSIFFHIRRSIRFVLIKMQNNGIQTDQLVINNLSIIINLLSFPFSNDWFYRTIWMEREKERNTK